MTWIRTIFTELLRLFVDDWGYALSILLWVAAVWLLLPYLPLPMTARGPIMFAGLAVILLESVVRRAGR
jgi:hypothetical protein